MSESKLHTTEMIIQGANCPMCLNATIDALRLLPGVVKVNLSATDQCLRIDHVGEDSERYVEVARTSLHGIAKYGNELVMVEVDPATAELHCTHG